MSLLQRLSREVEFARHVPLARMVRRLELAVRWGWSDLFPPRPPTAVLSAGGYPAPVFAPRTGMATRSESGVKLCFLNHEEDMGAPPVNWAARQIGVSGQLWRMHLHYMEFLEDLPVDEALDWIRDWIAQNPASGAGFWRDIWYPYTISLRTVVWMQLLARCQSSLAPGSVDAIRASLHAQIAYLHQHLETDLGGNHLLKNAKALLWASAFFRGQPAARWKDAANELFERELDVQILADGVHYERSMSYHAQVFADLLEARAVCSSASLADKLDAALARMAPALVDLTHPDGGPCLFNDAGLGMAYPAEECLSVYARHAARPSPRRIFAFAAAGYFGFRGDVAYCVVDCGRIGPDDLPAHAHGDILSFELSLWGQRVVVDPGVYEYTSGARRQASRSASSHNTLSIPGADQAEFFSRFRVGRRPGVEVLDYGATTDGFSLEGAHTGFETLPGRPRHVRRIEVNDARVQIQDRLETTRPHAAEIGALLHPDVTAHRTSASSVELRFGGRSARLACTAEVDIRPAQWWPDLGVELPTTRLVVRAQPGFKPIDTVIDWA